MFRYIYHFIFLISQINATNNIFLKELINTTEHLNKIYNFHNIIIYYNPVEYKVNEFIFDSNLNSPKIVIRTSKENQTTTTVRNLKFIICAESLAVVFLGKNNSKIFEELDLSLKEIHSVTKVIFIDDSHFNLTRIEEVFKWAFDKAFVYTLYFIRAPNDRLWIFKFKPFVEHSNSKIENVTDKSVRLFLEQNLKNFQGYEIQSPVFYDFPRVYIIKNPKTGKDHISGYVGKQFMTILDYINCTFKKIPSTSKLINISAVSKMFKENKLEICIHPLTLLNRNNITNTYSLDILCWYLMVPVQYEIPKYQYIVLAFSSYIWITTGFFFVYLIFVIRCIINVDYGEAMCYSLAGILYITFPGRIHTRICGCRQIFIFTQIIILGFILKLLYDTHMSSFLTSTVTPKQIDTLEDVIKLKMKIMIVEEMKPMILEDAPELEKLLVVVDIEIFKANRFTLNRNYSYLISGDHIPVYHLMQNYLQTKCFRIASNIKFRCFHYGLPIRFDSILSEVFRNLTPRIEQSGLIIFWYTRGIGEFVIKNKTRIAKKPYIRSSSLSLEHFTVAWYVLGFGLTASAICFFLEIFWRKK